MNLINLKDHFYKPLIEIEAVTLRPDPNNPFTWASGWKSPIYCDNRIIYSYPLLRDRVRNLLTNISQDFINASCPTGSRSNIVIAGVATGAIGFGVLIAEELNLPSVYVRSEAKSHGKGSVIEGAVKLLSGAKVVVIEDLISTGGSSIKVVQALREAGAEVIGMAAIFTYGFPKAEKAFAEADVPLSTIGNYNGLLEVVKDTGTITPENEKTLKLWRLSPDTWGKDS